MLSKPFSVMTWNIASETQQFRKIVDNFVQIIDKLAQSVEREKIKVNYW